MKQTARKFAIVALAEDERRRRHRGIASVENAQERANQRRFAGAEQTVERHRRSGAQAASEAARERI